MPAELKRRDLSGIYIFDTFPGESKRQPTCIEDCQPETRRKLLLTKSKEWLRDCIEQLQAEVPILDDILSNDFLAYLANIMLCKTQIIVDTTYPEWHDYGD